VFEGQYEKTSMFMGHWYAFCNPGNFDTLSKTVLVRGWKKLINIGVPEVFGEL
jgi:hypothetical protein